MRTFVATLLIASIEPPTDSTESLMATLTPDEVIGGAIGLKIVLHAAEREENVALTPAAISAFVKSGMLTEASLTSAEVF